MFLAIRSRRAFLIVSFVWTALIGVQGTAEAAPIVASESLVDGQPFELWARNLVRVRTSSTGYFDQETAGAVIAAQNHVDPDFGIYNSGDVTYRHDLTWLAPPPAGYLTAELEIKAFGVDGGNDVVFADTIRLGALANDGFLESFSTTIFENSNPQKLDLLFADRYLDIKIDKNLKAGFIGSFDRLSVYRSKLTVTYEAAIPIPEAGTVVLAVGAFLPALLRRRRRRRARR